MTSKICTRCLVEKEITFFNKRTKSKDGYTSACKSCRSKESKKHRDSNIESIRSYQEIYRSKNKKKLTQYFKQYDKLNPDTEFRKSQKREYYYKNKDDRKRKIKAWRDKNRAKINQHISLRIKSDPLLKLIRNTRTLIGNTIKRFGYTKKSKTFKLLDCSWIEFKVHIESQFTEGMSWDNIGKWHIDHKTPLSYAKNEKELIGLFHYTNTQPLWAIDNLIKGSKINYDVSIGFLKT